MSSPDKPRMADAATSATVYEVNADLDPSIVAAFDAWLPGHILEILKLPGFIGAEILAAEPSGAGDRAHWPRRTIQYRLHSPQDLDAYLNKHAPRLRADALQRFGERIFYTRRKLQHRAFFYGAENQ